MRKKLTYFAILASVAATLTVVSCAPDSPPTAPARVESLAAQQKLEALQDKYGWVGKYHTDGLAYIYTQLAKGSGKPRGRAEICKLVAKAAKEFHRTARHSEVPAGFVDPSLANEVCPSDDDGSRSVRAAMVVIPAGRARVRAELSSTATNYMDQIATLAGSASSKYALVSGVNSIESLAAGLSTEEAGAVVAVGSVALSSANYWEANLSSWMDLSGAQPAYALTAQDMTRATMSSVVTAATGRRFNVPWWKNPFVQGFQKVLVSDALAAARVLYSAWEMGPIALDAAAAAALWASSITALSLLFF